MSIAPLSSSDVRSPVTKQVPQHAILHELFDAGMVVSFEDRAWPREMWQELDRIAVGALAKADIVAAGVKDVAMMVTIGDVRLQYSSDDEDLCSFANDVLEELEAPGRLFRVDAREFVGYFTEAEADVLRERGIDLEDY